MALIAKSHYFFNTKRGCKKLRTFFISLSNISDDKERSQIQGLVIVVEKKAKAGHSLPNDKLRFEKYPENDSAHFFAN